MYLEKSDIEKGIQPEILSVISRNDDNIETAINDAVSEVGLYLRARYNIDDEFLKVGSTRNTFVVKLVRDIAIYNCYKASNPVNMPEAQILAYKDAVKTLEKVQGEKASIKDLERLSDEVSGSSYLKYGGNTKRNNHY
jgi:phage gp36-like protein